ncbi:MAG: hypothetical protein RI841_15820, partial [Halomonas sp.]|uniref:hypothetical protein n=1 Tax=Halomonas sp. TaxID=1486246 RepID=UPI0028700E59
MALIGHVENRRDPDRRRIDVRLKVARVGGPSFSGQSVADTALADALPMSQARAVDVARLAGISRSQLYSRLVPYGGFKTLLSEWRLERIARELCAPQQDATPIKSLV